MSAHLAPPQVIVDSPRPQMAGNHNSDLSGLSLFIRPPTSGAQTLTTCASLSRKNSQKRKASGGHTPPRPNKA